MNDELPTPTSSDAPAETAPTKRKPRRKKADDTAAPAAEASAMPPAQAEATAEPAPAPRRRSPRKPAAARKPKAANPSEPQIPAPPTESATPAEPVDHVEDATPSEEAQAPQATDAPAIPDQPIAEPPPVEEAQVPASAPAADTERETPKQEELAFDTGTSTEAPADEIPALPVTSPAEPSRSRKRRRRRGKANGNGNGGTANAMPEAAFEFPHQAEESQTEELEAPTAAADETTPEPMEAPFAPLQVISLGLEAEPVLAPEVLATLCQADCILGSSSALARLDGLGLDAPTCRCNDAESLQENLNRLAGRRLVVVATGDALCDGPAPMLAALLGPGMVQAWPGVGRVQAALAQLGLPAEATEVVDLAQATLADLRARLRRHRLLAIRLAEAGQAGEVGRLLAEAGFHDTRCWLWDGLHGERQMVALLVDELAEGDLPCGEDAVLVLATGSQGRYLELPGLETEAPAEALPLAVRLLALAWLQPAASETGWVIDSGDSSLALDWARAVPQGEVLAVGIDPAALSTRTAASGAGDNLSATPFADPRESAGWPAPDAVFLRGGPSLAAWLQTLWKRLPSGGRLVVSAEDEQARADLNAFAAEQPAVRWEELSSSHGETVAGRLRFAPAAPVRLVLWQKPQA